LPKDIQDSPFHRKALQVLKAYIFPRQIEIYLDLTQILIYLDKQQIFTRHTNRQENERTRDIFSPQFHSVNRQPKQMANTDVKQQKDKRKHKRQTHASTTS
jgi:hypothetical protein